jgi:hypothetical protein
MTQHILPEHIEEDRLIMRRLFTVIGVFAIASATMAVVITAIFS